MDSVQRDLVRKTFSKEIEMLREALEDENLNLIKIRGLSRGLNETFCKLQSLNESVEAKLLQEEDQEALELEYEEVDRLRWAYNEISSKAEEIMNVIQEEKMSTISGGSAQQRRNCNYRLPRLEFRKFGGDPKDWLLFWSQFRSIHEDDGMTEEEKFHYLVQATSEGSDARKVVEGFPPMKENYTKAIDYLTERFGNKDVMTEVYVRELLGIVLKDRGCESLSRLYDKISTQLRALESLQITSDKYGAMLFPLVESTLPEDTLRAWERNRMSTPEKERKDKLRHLMAFLKQEVDGEERVKMAQQFSRGSISSSAEVCKQAKESRKKKSPTTADLFSGSGPAKKNSCVYCEKHGGSGSDCRYAQTLSLEERKKILAEKKACYLCLRKGHGVAQCRSSKVCPKCQQRHDVSICPGEKKEADKKTEATSLSNHSTMGGVLLQTLMVKLSCNGEARRVRALIDTGSMRSYVTKKAVEVLKFPCKEKIALSHGLFGGVDTCEKTHGVYEVAVSSLDDQFSTVITMLDQDKICGSLSRIPVGSWMEEFHQQQIKFSDVGSEVLDIQVLLGADVAGSLFTGEIFKSSSGPVAMRTKLGWTVMGRIKPSAQQRGSSSLINLINVDYSMEKLWNLEVLGIRDPIEVEAAWERIRIAQEQFDNTIVINAEGRYEVGLPWVAQHPPVADNLECAKKRLFTATKRLQKEEKVLDYDKVFLEWEKLGIIEEVKTIDDYHVSYLPHRPVFNPSSSTTPIRPVFDASAKSNGLPSLNECLEKGENMIELVPSILSRFRLHKVGVTSDVKKAFLQISLEKGDRQFLRFLWWEDVSAVVAGQPEEERKLKVFQHCRVVFGVSSSPFLLAATLNHHLDKQPLERKKTAEELKRSLYVDNCLISVDSEDEAREFISKASHIMMEGKFELRGWLYNGGDESTKISVLGLQWDTAEDTLQVNLEEVIGKMDGKVTKRKILSAAHRIYDPIGFTAPATLLPKLLLQQLWDTKIGWDDEVPEQIRKQFVKWYEGLIFIQKVKVPRWVTTWKLEECSLSLHTFTDASKDASAACVFLRSEKDGQVAVQLIMAKSRVAPKNGTIPRLELLGCLIGARLLETVMDDLDLPIENVRFWTDSANALYWIQNEDNWNPYVYNRVKEINQLTRKGDWKHVSGDLNPADLPSRGCSGKSLLESRWWEGPTWLYKPEEDWPVSEINVELEVVMKEKRKSTMVALEVESVPWYLEKYSNYSKIIRLFAWILRWKKQARKSTESRSGYLSSEELQAAEKVLWRQVQKEAYPDSSQVLKQLNTVVDGDGLRRVKTKLVNREDTKDFCYPILLPHGHKLVRMMIIEEHKKMSHMGTTSLMCYLRERFWITKARITVKKALSSCVVCKRFNSRSVRVEEGTLPTDRVRDAAVLEVTGVDLGGPLHLKGGRKVWFALFTCAVYRAIHVEVVTSLSTEDFLKSLRRFSARRGRPAVIYSDNGRNFLGVSNLMNKLDFGKLESDQAIQGITWKFIPPASPWWGGFWERMIGLVKDLLKKNVGKAVLSYEELETVLCDIEFVINSRPLTYVTNEAVDPVALTPFQFLCGVKPYGSPDLDKMDMEGAMTRRTAMMMELRKRFRAEYLSKLRNHHKNRKSKDVKVGDLVFVGVENVKRTFWPLGTIVELERSADGVIRVAKVKTEDVVITRPLQKLFPVEINVDQAGEENEGGMQLRSGAQKK